MADPWVLEVAVLGIVLTWSILAMVRPNFGNAVWPRIHLYAAQSIMAAVMLLYVNVMRRLGDLEDKCEVSPQSICHRDYFKDLELPSFGNRC